MIAASLKVDLRHRQRLLFFGFRDHMIAASLKVDLRHRQRLLFFGFRDHMIAASLKDTESRRGRECRTVSAII